jgi:hypothetical protein
MQAPLPAGMAREAARRAARRLPQRHFEGTHYGTPASLRLRAALSDSPLDAASILTAALARKLFASAPWR